MNDIFANVSCRSAFFKQCEHKSPFDSPWLCHNKQEIKKIGYSPSGKLTFQDGINSIKREESNGGEKIMTQLVGILCEDRQKAIMVSDRMLTAPNGLTTFSVENKCKILNQTAIILYSGAVFNPDLINEINREGEKDNSIGEIASLLANKYASLRETGVTSVYLNPLGFSSFEEFHKKQKFLNPDAVKEIQNLIASFKIGIDLLLGGVDDQAHLFHIGDPGTYVCYDEPGFRCIGRGQLYAESIFSHYGFSPMMSEEEALYIGFEAKKRAEAAVGVGWATDAWIIDKNGVRKIGDEKIASLERYYEKKKNVSEVIKEIKKH